jgi:hypothetical protein
MTERVCFTEEQVQTIDEFVQGIVMNAWNEHAVKSHAFPKDKVYHPPSLPELLARLRVAFSPAPTTERIMPESYQQFLALPAEEKQKLFPPTPTPPHTADASLPSSVGAPSCPTMDRRDADAGPLREFINKYEMWSKDIDLGPDILCQAIRAIRTALRLPDATAGDGPTP